MTSQEELSSSDGAAFPWILEHLLTYPGTYEIPLRTMYTLNVSTQNQHRPMPITTPTNVPGNAFPRVPSPSTDEPHNIATATAAAQLKANLVTHISQIPSQPTSLPPSFITTFVRRCFPVALEQVDFPHALTALDYLKDLEVRRRREVVAALDRLGIERDDIGHKDKLSRKYPGVLKWVVSIEDKERQVEALYTQVYLGLRRWTLINELSLTPFNKPNCIAMLNTLYPPININSSQITQPTAQLTPQILATQRNGFFRYITAAEKKGPAVLSSLMDQHKRPGETTGWPCLRETLDDYLTMANGVIEECYEVTGGFRQLAATPTSAEFGVQNRRNIDSGISFGSTTSSNRSSGQSHATAASTSSSYSAHSRKVSKEKSIADKPLPSPVDDDQESTPKPPGSTLERIARELRKIRSKSNAREGSQLSISSTMSSPERRVSESQEQPPTPTRGRTIRLRRSLMRMRSNGKLRDNSDSRPPSRIDEHMGRETPLFDASEMKQQREQWEAQQKVTGESDKMDLDG